MNPNDARAAILNATMRILDINQKVGNPLPKDILVCENGEVKVASKIMTEAAAAPVARAGERVPPTLPPSSGMTGGMRTTKKSKRNQQKTRRTLSNSCASCHKNRATK